MILFITLIRIYKDYNCTRVDTRKIVREGMSKMGYNINYIDMEIEIYLN